MCVSPQILACVYVCVSPQDSVCVCHHKERVCVRPDKMRVRTSLQAVCVCHHKTHVCMSPQDVFVCVCHHKTRVFVCHHKTRVCVCHQVPDRGIPCKLLQAGCMFSHK